VAETAEPAQQVTPLELFFDLAMLACVPRVQVAFPAGEARIRVAIQPGTQLRK
jgi:deoxyxylulose-5-phosphate synthase